MKTNSVACIFLVVLLVNFDECKRTGGGRGKGSGRGSSIWNRSRARSQSPEGAKITYSPKKTSAPVNEPAIKQQAPLQTSQNAGVQNGGNKNIGWNSANEPKKPQAPLQTGFKEAPTNQRPIGWDVGHNSPGGESNINKNVGWNTHAAKPGYPNYPPPPYSSIAQPRQSYPTYSNAGPSNYYGTGTNYNYGSQYNAQQPFPGYYPTSNVGVIPPRGANTGQYYNSQGGFGNAPVFMGSHNGYGGGGYGGYGGGYGGYGGGFGGVGNSFGGKFGSGFGGNAYRNVLAGLLIWHLVSGFTRKPYNVYNYYNQPQAVPRDISLPADVITLCPENATALCAPNTYALCTSNNSILCVASAASMVPCEANSTVSCINSAVPCSDSSCKGPGSRNESTVNIPCIANATIFGNLNLTDSQSLPLNISVELLGGVGDKKVFCVTTLAMPQPEEQTVNNSSNVENVRVPLNTTSTMIVGDNNQYVANVNLTLNGTEVKNGTDWKV